MQTPVLLIDWYSTPQKPRTLFGQARSSADSGSIYDLVVILLNSGQTRLDSRLISVKVTNHKMPNWPTSYADCVDEDLNEWVGNYECIQQPDIYYQVAFPQFRSLRPSVRTSVRSSVCSLAPLPARSSVCPHARPSVCPQLPLVG